MQRTCSCIGSTSAGRECMATSAFALAACLQRQGPRCHGRSARIEAVSESMDSPVTSSAPRCMWCMRCMQLARISSPPVLRLWLEQQRISTEAIDADTTIFVSIGARSGGIRSCGWFSRISSRSWRQPSGLHQNQSRCAAAGAPMLPTAAPRWPRLVRSSRAPLVCLEHQASQHSARSKWRWPESDMQSLR